MVEAYISKSTSYCDFHYNISNLSNKEKGDYQERLLEIYFRSHSDAYDIKNYYSRLTSKNKSNNLNQPQPEEENILYTKKQLEEKTCKLLIIIATEKNILNRHKMKKSDLIYAILNLQ
jgi:hypothetical protein